jgi:hypothetical protein
MTESAAVLVVTSRDRLENETEWEFSPVHGVPGKSNAEIAGQKYKERRS